MSLISINSVKFNFHPLIIRLPFILFFLFCISSSIYSQEYETEEFLLEELADELIVQEELTDDEGDRKSNNAHLLQLGYYNVSAIDQRNNQSFSRPNVGLVFQQGAHNEVYILQAGYGNESSALQQGYGNDYELYLIGDENTTSLIQQGADNSVEQYITADGVDFSVVQQGVNNELIQVERNPEMPNYQVYQRGRGISIVIENISVY